MRGMEKVEITAQGELKSLSEKIRQYRSGEGVPSKPPAPDSMEGRVDLNADGRMFYEDAGDQALNTKDLDYEAAYENVRDQALNIIRKFPDIDFTALPRKESDLKTGLMDLEEWCYANRQSVAEEPQEPPAKTKRSKKKTKKAGKPEKKFQHWRNPGDACFIIEGNRVMFHHDGNLRDLSLKSHGKAQNLLVMLCGGILQSHDVKTKLCTSGTKPIQLVSRVNKQLNDKIRKLGFKCLPEYDVEFIHHEPRFGHYESVLKIFASRADFDRSEIERTHRD